MARGLAWQRLIIMDGTRVLYFTVICLCANLLYSLLNETMLGSNFMEAEFIYLPCTSEYYYKISFVFKYLY